MFSLCSKLTKKLQGVNIFLQEKEKEKKKKKKKKIM